MTIVIVKGYSKTRSIACFLLVLYLVLVYASTVFTRTEHISTVYLDGVSIPALTGDNYQLELFWSYRWGTAVCGPSLMRECLLNCIMLFPVGFLMPIIICPFFKKKRYTVLVTVTTGFVISASIEVMQLLLKRGLCETDDLFHNVLGVVAGCTVWLILHLIKEYLMGVRPQA